MRTVLIIEDEPVYASSVSRYLSNEGYDVASAETGGDGLAQFLDSDPDVVLLDLRLPDIDGFEICRRIRAESDTPIIILSARADAADKVLGLELGADDYATKDMAPRELLARIRAVIRRTDSSTDRRSMVEYRGYRIDRKAHSVTGSDDSSIPLTNIEFDLLWYLVTRAGEALSREQIFNDVWKQQNLGSSRTIDTHVVSLRTKLPDLTISSVRGVGYRAESDEAD